MWVAQLTDLEQLANTNWQGTTRVLFQCCSRNSLSLPFGHIPLNATLPVGVRATLDAVKGDLTIDEPAVK
jgi:hypothetical protein